MRLTRNLLSEAKNKFGWSDMGLSGIPNQKSGPQLWQDPILGYFETHGKMEFKPGEEYGLTEDQKIAVMERYRKKEMLKQQFRALEFNPQRFRYETGVIMDPAMYRWYATQMSNLERFRLTPKSVLSLIAFVTVIYYYLSRVDSKPYKVFDEECRSGKILWWDRSHRAIAVSAEGDATTGQL